MCPHFSPAIPPSLQLSDCAVCQEGYSPGYSHTCKSCLGGRGKRAVGVMSVIFGLVLLAAGLIIARLVSVVEIEQPAPVSGKVSYFFVSW